MAEDIVPGLLDAIKSDFQFLLDENLEIAKLYAKVNAGTATYLEAHGFAIEAGETLAEAFAKNLSSDVLPDGKMYYNIAERIISPMLENNHELVADISAQIQTTLNEQAGIGIKAIRPELNRDRIEGIVNKVSSAEQYDDVAWVLSEPVVNFTQSVVDSAVRANADFQYQAGLRPKITRRAEVKCCQWCARLAGTYEYADVKNTGNDVFRRHERCRCTVDYQPGEGKRVQDVWSKAWHSDADSDKIKVRKNVGRDSTEISADERSTRANWKLSSSRRSGDGKTIREELGKVSIDRAEETIKYFNDQIRTLPTEHAIVIDRHGEVIHFIGSEAGVDIFDADIAGAHITHNHPEINGIVSFGEDDFYFLCNHPNIASFSCCNPEYDYRITVIKPIEGVTYNQIYREGMMNYTIGDDLQDKAMEALAEKGYIKYEKSNTRK